MAFGSRRFIDSTASCSMAAEISCATSFAVSLMTSVEFNPNCLENQYPVTAVTARYNKITMSVDRAAIFMIYSRFVIS